MAERRVLICDKCDADGARRWTLGIVGKPTREVDLCDACAVVLVDLGKSGRPSGGGKRGPYKKFQKAKVKGAPLEALTAT